MRFLRSIQSFRIRILHPTHTPLSRPRGRSPANSPNRLEMAATKVFLAVLLLGLVASGVAAR